MKQTLKLFLSGFLYYSGMLSLKKFLNDITGKRLTVLTLHRVVPQEKENGLPTIRISTENFESLLRFVGKHYKVISLSECLEHFRTKTKFARSSLLVTFDDGYRDVLTHALPVLRKYRFPSVIFVPTQAVEQGSGFWWDALYDLLTHGTAQTINTREVTDPAVRHFMEKVEDILQLRQPNRKSAILDLIESLQDSNTEVRERVLSCLFKNSHKTSETVVNWQQLQEMAASGMTIGSHTVHHEFLSSISEEEAMAELQNSREKLETQLDTRIESFSYPGGRYNSGTVRSVEEAGYDCAFVAEAGINSLQDHRFKLKRINISDDNITTPKGKFSPALTAWWLFSK